MGRPSKGRREAPRGRQGAGEDRVRAALRLLPKMDVMLDDPRVKAAMGDMPRALARRALDGCLDAERRRILGGDPTFDVVPFMQRALDAVRRVASPRLRSVVNATGVVIHTNLGRAPLSAAVAAHVADVATHYSTLEFDVRTGERGSRHALVADLVKELTGAEDACVVNNNAAAVMLVLAELARDREVIVSRGELIEIGGSFRIPDIMALSGARMVEVGTTNKTHLADFERAITDQTALVLKVHPSNYRVMGFHEEADAAELARLAHAHGVMVYEDQGSGMLADLSQAGIPNDEHTVGWSLRQGVDVVSCSGDKLLGASQAGIILGSAELVGRIKKNPFMRAMRPDKLTLAALEATLRSYLDADAAWHEVPVLAMLSAPEGDLRARADRVAARVTTLVGDLPAGVALDVARATSFVGGGALPTTEIPTWVVRLRVAGVVPNELRTRLIERSGRPIVTRVSDDWLVCDVRTLVDEGDEEELARGVAELAVAGAAGRPDAAPAR